MLGKALKQYRTKHRITQNTLSRMSGVDRNTIARIERGVLKADEQLQAKLINALLRDKKHFRPENAPALERGEQLGLLLSTLDASMAEDVYMDIIDKLREYVGFQIDMNAVETPLNTVPSIRKYKRANYRFGTCQHNYSR